LFIAVSTAPPPKPKGMANKHIIHMLGDRAYPKRAITVIAVLMAVIAAVPNLLMSLALKRLANIVPPEAKKLTTFAIDISIPKST
jgi:hypothetical protein